MNKRLVFTGFFLLTAVLATAQTSRSSARDSVRIATVDRDSLGLDSLQRIGNVGSELVTMRRAADGNDIVLEVAGFGITLGQALRSSAPRKPGPRVNALLFDGTELGFNTLVGTDYADYPPEMKDFLDVRAGNSFHFSTTLVGLSVEMGRKREFEFSTGLRYSVDNYRLSDNAVTLAREGRRIVPLPLDGGADKSKLRITSLGIPLKFSYDPVRHLRIAVMGYCDFTLGANAIHKKPKVKNNLSGVNTFQFGLGGSVSYRGFGVYARYGVTSLFRSGVGPDCHPVSFGVCISM